MRNRLVLCSLLVAVLVAQRPIFGQVAAHLDQLRDGFNEHRAGLVARPAGKTRPDDILNDHVADHRWVAATAIAPPPQVAAQVHNEPFGAQWRSGQPRRARRLAAATFSARLQVQQVLPGELLDGRDAGSVIPGACGCRVGPTRQPSHGL